MNAITTLFYTNNAIEKTAANTIIVTNMQCATGRWSEIPSSYSEHRVSYGSWKTWKVLEKSHWSWKVLKIC